MRDPDGYIIEVGQSKNSSLKWYELLA
jgi:hypothetical protein